MKRETWYKIVYCILRPIGWLLYPQKTVGRHNVPEGAAILCANHSNAPDPVLISFGLGFHTYVRHFAKAEAKKIPVFGKLMQKIGSVFVHRGEQDLEAIKGCMRALKAGEKIIIFPEGTRVHGNDVVMPKSGAIHMASRLHVPIVPVYLPRDKKFFHPVRVVFGEPYYVEPQTHDDYDALASDLMDRIWALKE